MYFTSFNAASIATPSAKPTIDDAAAACLGLEYMDEPQKAIAVKEMADTISRATTKPAI